MKKRTDVALTVVGAYLRMLREEQRLSRTEVAAAAGTNDSQLVKIEAGSIDTRASLLLTLVRVLQGSSEDVTSLMTDPAATVDQAQDMARAWLRAMGRSADTRTRLGWLAESMSRAQREREGKPNKLITFPLPAELYEPLMRMAELQGRTLQGLLARIIGRAAAPDPAVKLFGSMLADSAKDLAQLDLLPQPSINHVYQGERRLSSPTNRIVTVDGRSLNDELGWNQDYEWGYGGHGPETLARAILVYEYGSEHPNRYSTRFAADVVEVLPRERGGIEWTLTSMQIHAWMMLVSLIEQTKSRHDGRVDMYHTRA